MRKNRITIAIISTSICFIALLIFLIILYNNANAFWKLVDDYHYNSSRDVIAANLHTAIYEKEEIYFNHINGITVFISIAIAFLGVITTFISFYVQYSFNKTQKEDLTNERFENQFFHLLDVWRTICWNTKIPNVGAGKNAFHYMFYEYKAIYFLAKNKFVNCNDNDELLNLCVFKIFIDGVSNSMTFNDELKGIDLDQNNLKKALLFLQNKSISGEQHEPIKYLRDYEGSKIRYFDGHRSRLYHYFSYLLFIIEFIQENEEKIGIDISMLVKYIYSEMTEHELGLFYSYCRYKNIITDIRYKDILSAIFSHISDSNFGKFIFDSGSFIS
jgi:hypothetical protein